MIFLIISYNKIKKKENNYGNIRRKNLKYDITLNKNLLRLDSFLNHQVDVNLMDKIGEEFFYLSKDKIIIIEISGIIPAYTTALKLNVSLITLKIYESIIIYR